MDIAEVVTDPILQVAGNALPEATLDDFASAAQQRFREISRRTRELWQHPLFATESNSRLRTHGVQALALSRSVCDELLQTTEGKHSSLSDLLDANESLLDWLTDRVHAAELYRPIALKLCDVQRDITRGTESTVASLASLAAEFAAAVKHGPQLSFENAADVSSLEEIFLPPREDDHQRCSQTLLTAWWLVNSVEREGLSAEKTQRLLLAALAQDIGKQVESPTIHAFQPYHPATGAAMLAGLTDAPAEVAMLVGAHHERCDGSGFPQRLIGSRFSPMAQRLASAVRFAELIVDSKTASATMKTGEPLDLLAGIRLWQEALRGAFDQALIRDVLETVRDGLAKAVEAGYPQHQRLLVEQPASIEQRLGTHRLDREHTAMSKPKFLQRRRSSTAISNPRTFMEDRTP